MLLIKMCTAEQCEEGFSICSRRWCDSVKGSEMSSKQKHQLTAVVIEL